jgi:hypothetical protein
MARKPRGSNTYYQVWISALNIDLSGEGLVIGPVGTAGTLLYQLEAAAHTLLDSEDTTADAALEAAPFIKLSNAGNPGNTGSDLKKVEFEARISGLQTVGDQAAVTAIIGLDGDRKNVYLIDVTLGVVKKGLNIPLRFEADNTGNAPDIKILKGENTGDIGDIWQEATLPLITVIP